MIKSFFFFWIGGSQGELAVAFGDLLWKLWSSGRTPIAPRAFKGKLARFAPQFSGYNQHDSQVSITIHIYLGSSLFLSYLLLSRLMRTCEIILEYFLSHHKLKDE